jgi:hypothetical protein
MAAQASKGFVPLNNQEGQTMAAVDSSDDIHLLQVDALGRLVVSSSPGGAGAPTNGIVNIPTAGTAVQMPTLTATSCTFQAPVGNVGNIYIGDSAVTNAAGAKEGIHMQPGWSVGNVGLGNLDEVWVDTDNNGDDIKYLCN